MPESSDLLLPNPEGPHVPNPLDNNRIPEEFRTGEFQVNEQGLIVPRTLGLDVVKEGSSNALALPDTTPTELQLPTMDQIVQLAHGSADETHRNFSVVEIANAAHAPDQFIAGLLHERLAIPKDKPLPRAYDAAVACFSGKTEGTVYWREDAIRLVDQQEIRKKKIGQEWIDIRSPSPLEVIGMTVIEAAHDADIQQAVSPWGEKGETASQFLLQRYADMLQSYRTWDRTDVKTIEMPHLAQSIGRTVEGFRRSKDRNICYDICEKIIIPLEEKETLLWSMDRNHHGRDLRHPLAYSLTMDVAVEKGEDSSWILEQKQRRDELLNILSTASTQELFDSSEILLKMSDRLVSSVDLSPGSKGKIGMEIEFHPYTGYTDEYKQSKYVDQDIADQFPPGFTLGRDYAGNCELRREFSIEALSFDLSYLQSLGEVHNVFDTNSAGIAGFHFHLDQLQHPNEPNVGNLFLVKSGEGLYSYDNPLGTWEIRGLFPPVDSRRPHTIDPAIIGDMVQFHIELAADGGQKKQIIRDFQLNLETPYSLKELGWGYILNLTDSPQAKLSALHTFRHPYLWNTLNPATLLDYYGHDAQSILLHAYEAPSKYSKLQREFLAYTKALSNNMYIGLWKFRKEMSVQLHAMPVFHTSEALDGFMSAIQDSQMISKDRQQALNYLEDFISEKLFIPRLFELVHDQTIDLEARCLATQMIGRSKSTERARMLIDFVHDMTLEEDIKTAAIDSMHLARKNDLIHKFILDVFSGKEELSERLLINAISTVGETQDPEIMRGVLRFLAPQFSAEIRQHAIEVLTQMDDSVVTNRLITLITTEPLIESQYRDILLAFGEQTNEEAANFLVSLMNGRKNIPGLSQTEMYSYTMLSLVRGLDSRNNVVINQHASEIKTAFTRYLKSEDISADVLVDALSTLGIYSPTEQVQILNKMISLHHEEFIQLQVINQLAYCDLPSARKILSDIIIDQRQSDSLKRRALSSLFSDTSVHQNYAQQTMVFALLRRPQIRVNDGIEIIRSMVDSTEYEVRRDGVLLKIVEDSSMKVQYRIAAVGLISPETTSNSATSAGLFKIIRNDLENLSLQKEIINRVTKYFSPSGANELLWLLQEHRLERLHLQIVAGICASRVFQMKLSVLSQIIGDPQYSASSRAIATKYLTENYIQDRVINRHIEDALRNEPRDGLVYRAYEEGLRRRQLTGRS